MNGNVSFARRVLVTVGLGAAVVAAVLVAWHARDVLLLAFAGVLFALFLRTPASWLSQFTSGKRDESQPDSRNRLSGKPYISANNATTKAE